MIAEILCVGTELLLGQVVNTNATHIAKGLASIGIDLFNQSVVGDNPERLKDAVKIAFSRSDILVMTGGLGPTFDDLTKETIAKYFGLEMELHQRSYDRLIEICKKFTDTMTQNNVKQAYMPKGAAVFDNMNGTAPGLAVTDGSKTAILMPGPPGEMKQMVDKQVMPYLMQKTGSVLVSKNVHVFGLGESAVEDMLKEYMLSMNNPTIAPYAKIGEMYLRVTAKAASESEALKLIDPVVDELKRRLGKYVYGVDAEGLEEALIARLKEKGLKIATAESCTGGLISKKLTDISGASAVFDGGVCTYSNEMKERLINVSHATLARFGAVSEQTAIEMAKGVKELFNADIGISTTGIAGPGGGSDEKPVGLVYVGIATKHGTTAHKLLLSRGYTGERALIRSRAVLNALHFALEAAQEL